MDYIKCFLEKIRGKSNFKGLQKHLKVHLMKKYLLVFILTVTAFFTIAWQNLDSKSYISAEGQISKIQISSWQYGTHILKDNTGRILLALRSSIVNLQNYEGKFVILEGDIIQGYPVDEGPRYVDVKRIKEQQKFQVKKLEKLDR